jgi:hypothetical protein
MLIIGHTQTHVFNAGILKLDYDVVKDCFPHGCLLRSARRAS